MSTIELILYIVLFTAITLALAIPAINWYKYNVSMTHKKKLSVYFLIGAIVMISVFLIFLT